MARHQSRHAGASRAGLEGTKPTAQRPLSGSRIALLGGVEVPSAAVREHASGASAAISALNSRLTYDVEKKRALGLRHALVTGLAAMGSTIYDDISEGEGDLYVLVGGKKYLLLQNSEGKPLASPSLEIEVEEGRPFAGSWYGRFHAPPQEVGQVSLTIPGVEPIEPIAITDH